MVGIERANPDTLSGLFSSFDDASWTDKGKLSDERLKDLVEHFSAKKFGNGNYSADMMGDAYEYLIKKFADMQKKNATVLYPARNRQDDGLASRAEARRDRLRPRLRHGRHAHRGRATDRQLQTRLWQALRPREEPQHVCHSAYEPLFHGAKDFRIAQGDTLREPAFRDGDTLKTFDCVLANPPFSLKNWGSDEFSSDPSGVYVGRSHGQVGGLRLGSTHGLLHGQKERSLRRGAASRSAVSRWQRSGAIRKELIKSDGSKP